MKVLFLDTVHPSLQQQLEESKITCIPAYDETPAEIAGLHPDAAGLVIRSRFMIDSQFLESFPALKFIARAGAGMENIDVDAAAAKNIICLNAPEGNRNAVAEHALGMLLSLFNNLGRADRQVREGIWLRKENRGIELAGKVIGIIGFGNTGSSFASVLTGFNAKVLAYDKYKTVEANGNLEPASLDSILHEADIISFHVPLTKETTGMLNASFIEKARKPFYLINTSRGKVADTNAIADGLRSGKLLGACLDVLDRESVSFEKFDANSPALQYLFSSEKVMLSPHIAGWTRESHRLISEVLAEKILSLLARL